MVLAAPSHAAVAQPLVVATTMQWLREHAGDCHRDLGSAYSKTRLQPIKRPNGAGFVSGQCMYCGVETAAARPPDARMGVWFECLLCREQYDCHVCGHNDYWYNGLEKIADVLDDAEHNLNMSIRLSGTRGLALLLSMASVEKDATIDDWRTARKLRASKARAVNAKRRVEIFYARCLALMERMGVEHGRFLAETAMSDP